MNSNFIIEHNKTIKDALILINKNARGIVFIVNKKKLIGVITDGDIRRFLMKGLKISSSVIQAMNSEFTYLNINNIHRLVMISS